MPDGSGLAGDQREVSIVFTSDDWRGAATAWSCAPTRSVQWRPSAADAQTMLRAPTTRADTTQDLMGLPRVGQLSRPYAPGCEPVNRPFVHPVEGLAGSSRPG